MTAINLVLIFLTLLVVILSVGTLTGKIDTSYDRLSRKCQEQYGVEAVRYQSREQACVLLNGDIKGVR